MTDTLSALQAAMDGGLLPCPFCGGKAYPRGDYFAAWIQCDQCGAEGPTRNDDGGAGVHAGAAWNRRDHGDTLQALARDAVRLDALEAYVHANGGLVIHDYNARGNYAGLGLAGTQRTLREALDAALAQEPRP